MSDPNMATWIVNSIKHTIEHEGEETDRLLLPILRRIERKLDRLLAIKSKRGKR